MISRYPYQKEKALCFQSTTPLFHKYNQATIGQASRLGQHWPRDESQIQNKQPPFTIGLRRQTAERTMHIPG
jgi:hypothetical protein